MLVGPSVLLLDEPSAALDKESAKVVFDVLQRLNREQGTTIILVAHGDEVLAQPGVNILGVSGKTYCPGLKSVFSFRLKRSKFIYSFQALK